MTDQSYQLVLLFGPFDDQPYLQIRSFRVSLFRLLHIEGPTKSLIDVNTLLNCSIVRAHEMCESGGGRHGTPSLTVFMASVDVKQH